ncbi:MAG TPA: protocatechuate 3,4-dioxygenase subunit alpha [Chloroflexota bacterium]
MSALHPTGSQTVGPFFGPAMLREGMLRQRLDGPGTSGRPIRIEGRVLDGDGAAVPDALIEIWQANAHGRYDHPADDRDLPLEPSFSGFGRAATDDDGRFWFETIKPGPVPGPGGAPQAPHLVVTVFARGLLNHVVTRFYFEDEPANGHDPILALVPAARRGTLLARLAEEGQRPLYRRDVVLQGEGETAFFNL